MNLVQARMDAVQGQLQVGDQILDLPAHLASVASRESQDVLLGIRPNAFAIAAPQTKGGLVGAVSLVEHVGAESIITVRLDSAKTAHDRDGGASDEIMVTESGYSNLSAGNRVCVTMDLGSTVIFSATSGQRISTDLPLAANTLH